MVHQNKFLISIDLIMKNFLVLLALSTLFSLSVEAQKFYTRDGHISFFSTTPVEDIKADNYQVSSILNAENGELVFSVLMKGFEFEKALMEEHFNEKYVHSDEYPKATFKGQIDNWGEIDMGTDGVIPVTVTGVMNLHGVEQEITQEGELTISEGAITDANANFDLALEDYEVKIPSIVKENISETVLVTVLMQYQLYGK